MDDDERVSDYLAFARAHRLLERTGVDRITAMIAPYRPGKAMAVLLAYGYRRGYGDGFAAGALSVHQEQRRRRSRA